MSRLQKAGRMVLLWLFSTSLAAQEANWVQMSPTASPSMRDGSAMVYDAAGGQVVLFGGVDYGPLNNGLLNDTWVWDGNNWAQLSPANNPGARYTHGMAYDSARQQVVVFGGTDYTGQGFADTWVWDGTNWTPKNPASSPSARYEPAMAYDQARSEIVLFGGNDNGNGYKGDTWVWDGINWTQKTPAVSPPSRAGHAMAYDVALGQLLLLGGDIGVNNFSDVTWVWNGTNWTQKTPATSPGPRIFHAMAYDAGRGQVVLFGGTGAYTAANSGTWVWRIAPGPVSTIVGRPILFVHGWCGDESGWSSIRTDLINQLMTQQPGFYTDATPYTAYYDGNTVHNWPEGTAFPVGVSSSARFFSINFFDFNAHVNGQPSIDTAATAYISIFNKADELAQVIHAITKLTHVQDVILVAHSQGGLVARTYIENLAVPWSRLCDDSYNCLADPSRSVYAQDIGKLVTLDTPHSGALTSNLIYLTNANLGCFGFDTLNRRELAEGSGFLSALNNSIPGSPPNPVIAAIKSYVLTGTDGIVTASEQSIERVAPGVAGYYDVENSFLLPPLCPASFFILHLLTCVGGQEQTRSVVRNQVVPALSGRTTSITLQATLDGNPWAGPFGWSLGGPGPMVPKSGTGSRTYVDLPPGVYFLAYSGSGPSASYSISPSPQQILGWDPDAGTNNPSLAFTIRFVTTAPPSPLTTTVNATNLSGSGARLQGTVNPNGGIGSAWFEWGTSPSLATFNVTAVQSVGPGSNPVSAAFDLSGLSSNTVYSYRMAANATGGAVVRGNILTFATSATLPAPTLLTPAFNATGIATSPTLSWRGVANATSYRLILATNSGALPSDPTSALCGAGCLLNVTLPGLSYIPPVGPLAPQTTYYWEVHARSADRFGDWSAIFSFRTGTTDPGTILSATPNPSTFGHPVTLTAAVRTSATGLVTFYDGTTVLGTNTVSGGQATLTTSLLPVGARQLRAFYNGDTNYAAGNSSSIQQTVNQVATCDINGDGTTNVSDVQLIINEALGVAPAVHDLNGDFVVNVADVQKVINAALGLG